MPERTTRAVCVASGYGGRPCDQESLHDAPFPICGKHAARVMTFIHDSTASARAVIAAQRRPVIRSVVYYVRVGDHVKIGTTSQEVRKRVDFLPPDRQVLAVEPGDQRTERLRHRQFRHQRVSGEWFRPDAALWAHITRLRGEHGAPDESSGGMATLGDVDTDRFVSATEAAEMASVDSDTIRKWCQRHHLAPSGIDEHGRLLYRAVDVMRVATRDKAGRTFAA